MAASLRGAVVVDDGGRGADELLGKAGRIGDGGGLEDELGVGTVEGRQAAQTAQHHAHVGSKDPAIAVGLVHHHVAQAGKESAPAAVIGQEPQVQHVRIREQEGGRLALDAAAGRRGGVAVIDGGLEARGATGFFQALEPRLQDALLVLGQGFDGVKIKRMARRVRGQAFQHGQQATERLAAGRGGDERDMAAQAGRHPGRRLDGCTNGKGPGPARPPPRPEPEPWAGTA